MTVNHAASAHRHAKRPSSDPLVEETARSIQTDLDHVARLHGTRTCRTGPSPTCSTSAAEPVQALLDQSVANHHVDLDPRRNSVIALLLDLDHPLHGLGIDVTIRSARRPPISSISIHRRASTMIERCCRLTTHVLADQQKYLVSNLIQQDVIGSLVGSRPAPRRHGNSGATDQCYSGAPLPTASHPAGSPLHPSLGVFAELASAFRPCHNRRRSLHPHSGHRVSHRVCHMAIPRSEPRVPSPPRFVPHGVFSLQLTAPVAEALQRQPVPLAILALRQAAKLPDLKVTAPESARRPSFTQRKSQRFPPRHARHRDRLRWPHRGREQTVREMDAYINSLFRE